MSKTITILGAGESGTGAALLAKAHGWDVFVSDQGLIKEKYKAELVRESLAFEEGAHSLDRILQSELIIKSPGIPGKAEVIQKAKARGIEMIDELEFAFRYLTGNVIAITGTNGKTTTTLLTHHLLKSAGYRVALAGNVGESLARKVAFEKHDWYVVEISSFQLDGTQAFHPFIGILLNITPDHLDRYEYRMENYVASKFQLVRNMTPADHFIFYQDDAITSHEVKTRSIAAGKTTVSLIDSKATAHAHGTTMFFRSGSQPFSIDQRETTLKGPHNLINTMSAVSAALHAGVSEKVIRQALKTFKNAPHRLESVATVKGVEFVNDSKATNVDSVVYALGSYEQPLIWIAGGIDKGNDYSLLQEAVRKKVKALICLGADNTKLRDFFLDLVPVVHETHSVKEAVWLALREGRAGDVALLSPACASFDLFKNYEDRGTQFREAVQALKQETEKTTA
ncbi:MAG: UDP-N-acetylmuramoyl-L-alanine--D-glutamate ligase [Cyclobacteriaceae bacterium]|jgi:UDP-N-acetylmuramoylalanine--D-glutamate ligase|nr:UDP-N-acetylmuramoyl-L-alanine--D-glutamate ligase [Cyclobacteriaceae bacterium]